MIQLLKNLPLITFLIFIINYMIGAFFIVYHLLKFGLDYKTRVLLIIFIFGLTIFLPSAFYLFFKIDWSAWLFGLPI